jgi:hypothetical protein
VMKADSFATNPANCAGGMPTPSRPCASNCWRTSGSASAFQRLRMDARRRSRGGAPAGSHSPEPVDEVVVLEARFLHRRHVGQALSSVSLR